MHLQMDIIKSYYHYYYCWPSRVLAVLPQVAIASTVGGLDPDLGFRVQKFFRFTVHGTVFVVPFRVES